MIHEIKENFYLIKNEGSIKKKQELLKDMMSNKAFARVLYFAFNDYIVTGLSSKKINKKLDERFYLMENKWKNDIFLLLDYLTTNNTGRDEDIAVVQAFIRDNLEHKDFLVDLVTKNIKVGITATTINKVKPNFIPEFGVQLANSYDLKYVDGKDFIITLKLDGSRMVVIKENDDVKCFSRQGKEITELIEIETEFEKMPNGVYDGELLAIGEFEDSKTQFKETMKRSRIKGEKTGLKFMIYDYICDINDFKNGKDNTRCIDRKNTVKRLINNIGELEFIQYLEPLYVGNDITQITKYSDLVIKQGQEGIMINLCESPYETKRVNHLLKVKEFHTLDLRVIDKKEGTNRNKGKLGALVVDYKGFEVSVGSGYTDTLREELWNDEDIVGRVIEISYFEETCDKDGNLSLRFPVFIRVRELGKEVSYY